VVDFNKSCEEVRGKFLHLSGVPVYYRLCRHCGFCFAPEFSLWKPEEFRRRIYNDGYLDVDPDYREVRPRANARNLLKMFRDHGPRISHLDYGGGSGILSALLAADGWQSRSYDPFVETAPPLEQDAKFELITAFEVFEHVPQPKSLVAALASLLHAQGMVLFSTLASDRHIAPNRRLTWWYASPRNGHISLYSRKSLAILGKGMGFNFGSFSTGFHAYWKSVPLWAQHIFRSASSSAK
jgi:hypothetical protein